MSDTISGPGFSATDPIPCPRCGARVTVTGWSSKPTETTDDVASAMHRTFEPGLSADVTLSCGHEVHGADGVSLLDRIQREREYDREIRRVEDERASEATGVPDPEWLALVDAGRGGGDAGAQAVCKAYSRGIRVGIERAAKTIESSQQS